MKQAGNSEKSREEKQTQTAAEFGCKGVGDLHSCPEARVKFKRKSFISSGLSS
jgi:hypothetical protein